MVSHCSNDKVVDIGKGGSGGSSFGEGRRK